MSGTNASDQLTSRRFSSLGSNGSKIQRFLIALLQRGFLAFLFEGLQEFGIFPCAGFGFLLGSIISVVGRLQRKGSTSRITIAVV